MRLTARITFLGFFLFSIQSILTMEPVEPETESTHALKKYFRKARQLQNTLTPVDDILFKTNDSLAKVKRCMSALRTGFDLAEEHLQELSQCHTDLMLIKSDAEKIIIADEELQTLNENSKRTHITRQFIKRVQEETPELFDELKVVQKNIGTSLHNLTKPLCASTKPKITKSVMKNGTDAPGIITSCGQLGQTLKEGCSLYQKKRAALLQVEEMYRYFLSTQEMENSYDTILGWLDGGINCSVTLYQQCKTRSLQAQEDLITQIRAIIKSLKKFSRQSLSDSDADPKKLTDGLHLSKDVFKLLLHTNIDTTHFIAPETLSTMQRLKKEAENEVAKLEQGIADIQPKKPQLSSSFKIVNAQELLQETQKCPFSIIVPLMAGSYLQHGSSSITPPEIFLGSFKTYKIPLSKIGKTNSKKGLAPVYSIEREAEPEKLHLLFDKQSPSQVWQDHTGYYYITDLNQDKDYAYRIEQIMSVRVQVKKPELSPEQPTHAKV